MPRKIRPLADRFWEKVDRRGPDECWPWTGGLDAYGYGKIGRSPGDTGSAYAHRVSWELANGPVPDGLVVCHSCDLPRCVNPAHLRPDTYSANLRERWRRGSRSTVDFSIPRRPKVERIERVCIACGLFFTVQPAMMKTSSRNYCTPLCYREHRTRPLADRFWEKVNKTEGCWLWTAGTNSNGYGVLAREPPKARMTLASRISWELHHGTAPGGKHVCHHCDNPLCVRPDHLFLGTRSENMQDMKRKGRQGYHGSPGEKNSQAKLTDANVREIRRRAAAGEKHRLIAADFGITDGLVSQIHTRYAWKHIA